MHQLINFAYLVASILFILCLRGLSSPERAKRGVYLGELGMFIAIVATLLKAEVIRYEWIIAGMVLGVVVTSTLGRAFDLPLSAGPGSIVMAVGTSAAIGLIFGYLPARRAAKLDPIDALRTD